MAGSRAAQPSAGCPTHRAFCDEWVCVSTSEAGGVGSYSSGETRPMRVKVQEWTLEIKGPPVETFSDGKGTSRPLIRTERE